MRTPHRRGPDARRRGRAFSLVELMIVVAVAALIIGLAAPSFSDYIVTQRVRSIHAQLVTDLQFARSEAVSRGAVVAVQFEHRPGAGGHSCYPIYRRTAGILNPRYCTCLNSDGTVGPEGARCTASDTSEIRSVIIENRSGVTIRVPDAISSAIAAPYRPVVNFDPRTGSYWPGDSTTYPVATLLSDGFSVTTKADDERALTVIVNEPGRPQQCTPAGSRLGGGAC